MSVVFAFVHPGFSILETEPPAVWCAMQVHPSSAYLGPPAHQSLLVLSAPTVNTRKAGTIDFSIPLFPLLGPLSPEVELYLGISGSYSHLYLAHS